MGWTLSKFMPKCKRTINQRVGLSLDCTLFLPGWPFQQCFFFFKQKWLWPKTLSYYQFRAASWGESPECHTAPTKAGWGGQHWMGKIEPALSRLAEKTRRGPRKTPGTSGSNRGAGPQTTSGWGDQGILAACGWPPHWLSPRSPRKSQGTIYCFASELFERLKRGSDLNLSARFSSHKVKNRALKL